MTTQLTTKRGNQTLFVILIAVCTKAGNSEGTIAIPGVYSSQFWWHQQRGKQHQRPELGGRLFQVPE